MAIGDRWGDDESQMGDDSLVSLDYFREKFREFQAMMNAADLSYKAALSALQSNALSDSDAAELADLVMQYESKRGTMKATAEAMNAAAATVNAMGGRMPSLSIPGTLGLLPALTLPALGIVTAGVTVTLVSWGNTFIRSVANVIERGRAIAAVESLPVEQRAQALATLTTAQEESRRAVAVAEQSGGLSALAPIAKLVTWAAAGFLIYKLVQQFGGSGSGQRRSASD
jgi:hypothetical protein